MPVEEAMEYPTTIKHQTAFLHARVDREKERQKKGSTGASGDEFEGKKRPEWVVPSVVGEHTGHRLKEEEDLEGFIEWLKDQYDDLAPLTKAWNTRAVSLVDGKAPVSSWDHIREFIMKGGNPKEYHHITDIMRYNANKAITKRIGAAMQAHVEFASIGIYWPEKPKIFSALL